MPASGNLQDVGVDSSGSDQLKRASSSEASSSSLQGSISSPEPPQYPSGRREVLPNNRKRKRAAPEDDVEGKYLKQLALEEAKEQNDRRQEHDHRREKLPRLQESDGDDMLSEGSEEDDAILRDGDRKGTVSAGALKHESTLNSKGEPDLEKASRTVFLANVSTSAIKSKSAQKSLHDHLLSFTSSLPQQSQKHGIESLRFRSTAFTSNAIPKKAAFAKKELMDTTTQSTNAYVVYTTQAAAREACKVLNGSIILGRHLRVDSVAHPSKTDHRRCVFVGNLGFVDDMTNMDAMKDEEHKTAPKKAKAPADMEEGLWRHFGDVGTVESVRVVRDKTTRVGKGFAYVQFTDVNAVEKALSYNRKKFPPMLPRILRVTRAKNVTKVASQKSKGRPKTSRPGPMSSSSNPSMVQNVGGRAGKLLGKAGAAHIRAVEGRSGQISKDINSTTNPKMPVFEGYRARQQQGKGTLRKSHGKPQTRSSKRGAEFKAKGGKKKTKS